MKTDAIKRCAAAAGTNDGPSDADVSEAIGEGVALLVGFLANVERIADNIEAMNREGITTTGS